MKRTRIFAFAFVGLLAAAGALAQGKPQQTDSIEQRLERIEQALGRLEAKASSTQQSSMMDKCQEMMKGGMMGRGGMMSGKRSDEHRSPDTAK